MTPPRWIIPTLLACSAAAAVSSQGVAPVVRFRDVTKAAGVTFTHNQRPTPEKHMSETFGSGVAWIDFDNDGFQDLYFVNGAPGSSNVLYRNNGNGAFSNVTTRAGVAMTDTRHGHKTGVAVGDIDNDGFADLYVGAFGTNVLYLSLIHISEPTRPY